MSKINATKVAKYEAIVKKLEDNQQVWQAIGALQSSVNDIKNHLASLRTPESEKRPRGRAKKIVQPVTDYTIKKSLKTLVAKKVTLLAGSLYAYAIEAQNNELKGLATLDQAKIEKKNDKQVLLAGLALLDIAKTNLQNLAYYGVSQEELNTLEVILTEFKATLTKPKAIIVKPEKVNKVKINGGKILREIDAILEEKVDRLLLRFEDSHTAFYKSYKRTRTAMSKKSVAETTVTDTIADANDAPKKGRGRPKKVAVA